jgi:hypothetical protein
MAKATPQHLDDPTEYKDYKPEEAGSGIRVDGKPIKSTSKKDIDPLGEAADNTMKMIARKRATAEEAGKSKMNAMGDTYAKGGMTASKRADGIAQRGKTRGTMVMCGGGMAK